jgi:hypothetical protein
LSSHQCCTLMFWADKAGISEAKAFALRPEAPSGHASRKLRLALGHTGSPGLYEAEMPGHARRDLERSSHSVSVLPLHEQLAQSLDGDVGALTKLAERRAADDLPLAYTQHKVVLDNPGDIVIPIAVFLDAVPYSQTDSVLGCWGLNVLTGRRFLFSVIRKRHVCRCGCRGWCTYNVLFMLTRWSLESLALGVWPAVRHDGSGFRLSDSWRASKAGQTMPFNFACIYVKGDWAEHAHTLGLPAWNDGLRPCFACVSYGPDLYVGAQNDGDSLRWHCNEPGDFEAACARCEIVVAIDTIAQRSRIADVLRYDKRPAYGLGRTLGADLLEFGLAVHDRIEPSSDLPDVGLFESTAPPFIAVFWRRGEESLCRHRNPLFSESYGVSAESSLTVDTLHAFYLGVMNTWCRVAVWILLLSGVYGVRATSDDSLTVCCLSLRSALFVWYGIRRRDFPDEVLTQLNDLTPAMLGSQWSPKCKTKGAETWAFLLFLLSEIRKYGTRLGDDFHRIRVAGECLESMVLIWRRCPWKVPSGDIQDCVI